MTRFLFSIALGFAFIASGGCAPSAQVRTYDIYVTNKLDEPVTVFLTKDGPPVEEGWLSPAELAAGPVNQDALDSGQVVGPGVTVDALNRVGHFAPQTAAVLRVYRKTGKLEDFAAISSDNPKRTEVPLRPGVNAFVIVPDGAAMSISRVPPPTPSK